MRNARLPLHLINIFGNLENKGLSFPFDDNFQKKNILLAMISRVYSLLSSNHYESADIMTRILIYLFLVYAKTITNVISIF